MTMTEATTHLRRALQYSQEEYNKIFFNTAYDWLQCWFSDDLEVLDAMTKVSKRREFWDYWQLSFDAIEKGFIEGIYQNRDKPIFQDLEFVRAIHLREHSTHDLFPEVSFFEELVNRYNETGIDGKIEPAQIRSSCFKLNDLNAKVKRARKKGKLLRMSVNGVVFCDTITTQSQPKKV